MFTERDIELAWAAGFFDGEGTTSCTIQRSNNHRNVRCSVAQKGEPILLNRFLKAVDGIGFLHGPYKGNMYSWSTGSHDDCATVVSLLWPFLGEIKRTQATEALKKFESWVPIEDVNYTMLSCPHCDVKTRPGPMVNHIRKHEREGGM